jgi:predicted RNA-binding Zn-ribbon protein involved in translation (DUF1610 family)
MQEGCAMARRDGLYLRFTIWKCPECGKASYLTRKVARAAAKHNHPSEQMRAYQCRDGAQFWHYGHNSKRKG